MRQSTDPLVHTMENSNQLFRIGQHIHCILYGGKDGVINQIDGQQSPETVRNIGPMITGGRAYLNVLWDDGAIQPIPESIARGVQWRIIDKPDLTADEVKVRELQATIQRAQSAEAEQSKLNQHTTDKDRIVAEMRTKYPWAAEIKAKGLSGHAAAAACIKRELRDAFPGVTFSVRSELFSMGNSVSIGWELGPTTKQVESITGKYAYGSFDSSDDSYNHDHSAHSDAVGIVLAQAKYVSENRNVPDALRARVIAEYGKMSDRKDWDLERAANELLSNTSFAPSEEYAGIIWDKTLNELVIQKTSPAPLPPNPNCPEQPTTSSDGATITHNAEKGGVEIRFPAKPGAHYIERLKQQGFRWSRFNSVWYKKSNPANIAFAESIVAEFNGALVAA